MDVVVKVTHSKVLTSMLVCNRPMRPALTIQINLCVSQSVKDCQGVDFNKCTTTTTTKSLIDFLNYQQFQSFEVSNICLFHNSVNKYLKSHR